MNFAIFSFVEDVLLDNSVGSDVGNCEKSFSSFRFKMSRLIDIFLLGDVGVVKPDANYCSLCLLYLRVLRKDLLP